MDATFSGTTESPYKNPITDKKKKKTPINKKQTPKRHMQLWMQPEVAIMNTRHQTYIARYVRVPQTGSAALPFASHR